MMSMKTSKASSKIVSVILIYVLCVMAAPAGAQSMDELYKLALKEGGTLNFYGTLAQINAERILPVFEKRFPGIKVSHVDATADKLAARAIAEARGGRVLSDVFQMALENVLQVIDQKLVVDWLPPEAAAYPATLKGANWLAADMVIITTAWNTNLVKKEDEPKQFDDLADPKWKGKLIAEARDVELLIGLATHKYKNDEKAFDYIRKLAANNVEFHKGHSELAEFLVAGQAAACLTCYAHHYPLRIKKGAPLGYMLTEGIATITADALAKDPPHPKVEPVDNIRPAKLYPIGTTEIKQWPKYEKVWKEIFKLR